MCATILRSWTPRAAALSREFDPSLQTEARVKQQILSHTYENGLVLVAEPMASVESAAFSILLPCGSAHDPPGLAGLATLTNEMMLRGCGSRDSRQFVDDLDNLGVERGESVSAVHASFGGAT